MKKTSIPKVRQYVYFYVFVLLATAAIVFNKPEPATPKAQNQTRAAAVNNLANALFQ